MTADVTPVRTRILRAIRAEINVWEYGYAVATIRIARALADGRLPVAVVAEFPLVPSGHLCEAVAHAAGLPFVGDPPVHDGAYLSNVDSDHVTISIELLRQMVEGTVSVHGDGLSFYDETLNQHNLTLDHVADHLRGLSLLTVARLIDDASRIPLHQAC